MRWNSAGNEPVRTGMRVILAQPRGFCAGVVRAIEIVERALKTFGPPVYVRHEIVHNRHVVESLQGQRRPFCRGFVGSSGRGGDHLQRPWRCPRGRGRGRAARAQRHRRHLSAGQQGAQPGQPLCARRPPAHPDRPCRPSGGRGHQGPHPGAGAPGADRRRCGKARPFRAIPRSPMSPRRPCRWTTPAASSPPWRRNFPT